MTEELVLVLLGFFFQYSLHDSTMREDEKNKNNELRAKREEGDERRT